MHDEPESPRFLVPLPGGRVAEVPLTVLESYARLDARSVHAAPPAPAAAAPDAAMTAAPEGLRAEALDVVAHSLGIDPSTGTSSWHTDWEFGECEYVDESGFPQRLQAWHRHPFGTEYAEPFEGR